MEQKHARVSDTQQLSDVSFVYLYLIAGITLLLTVFLFLPRIATG